MSLLDSSQGGAKGEVVSTSDHLVTTNRVAERMGAPGIEAD
jgi:hypothetical protein